jgi:hypothetical protein
MEACRAGVEWRGGGGAARGQLQGLLQATEKAATGRRVLCQRRASLRWRKATTDGVWCQRRSAPALKKGHDRRGAVQVSAVEASAAATDGSEPRAARATSKSERCRPRSAASRWTNTPWRELSYNFCFIFWENRITFVMHQNTHCHFCCPS